MGGEQPCEQQNTTLEGNKPDLERGKSNVRGGKSLRREGGKATSGLGRDWLELEKNQTLNS